MGATQAENKSEIAYQKLAARTNERGWQNITRLSEGQIIKIKHHLYGELEFEVLYREEECLVRLGETETFETVSCRTFADYSTMTEAVWFYDAFNNDF